MEGLREWDRRGLVGMELWGMEGMGRWRERGCERMEGMGWWREPEVVNGWREWE